MRRRGISEADVELVLGYYTVSYPGKADEMVYRGAGTDGRPVKVVAKPDDQADESTLVITTARIDEED